MMIIFCLFSIIGCYLFSIPGSKDNFIYINQYYNTDNFYNSFLLTFRASTGENWPLFMLEFSRIDPKVDPSVSYLYFIFLIFFCAVIMLNLFILVILQQYEEFNQKGDNPIERFSEMLEYFKKTWNQFSFDEDKGERLNMVNVTQFLFELEGDLSLDIGDDKEKRKENEILIKEKIKIAIMELKFIV